MQIVSCQPRRVIIGDFLLTSEIVDVPVYRYVFARDTIDRLFYDYATDSEVVKFLEVELPILMVLCKFSCAVLTSPLL